MNIDKLLKSYARHRRETAGSKFELRAATRHVLQGEVVRTYRGQKERTQSNFSRAAGFWLRLGLSAGVFACFALVLAVIYPVLFPKSDSKSIALAKQDKPAILELHRSAEPRPNAPRASRAPVPATAPTELMSDSLASGSVEARSELKESPPSQKVETRDRSDTQVAAVETNDVVPIRPEAKAMGEPTLRANRSNRRLSANANPAPRRVGGGIGSGGGMLALPPQQKEMVTAGLAASPSNTNIVVAMQVAKSKPIATESPKSIMYFNNQAPLVQNQAVTAQIKDSPTYGKRLQESGAALSPVLNSFQFRQQGDKVTIIDADGSEYKGQIVTQEVAGSLSQSESVDAQSYAKTASSFSNQAAVRQVAGRLQNRTMPQAQNAVSFQATGLNRLSRQNVSIQGQIVGVNNSLAANSIQSNTQASQFSNTSTNRFFGLYNNTTAPIRIQGQVIVDDTNRLEIDAIQQVP